ncbi:hypothetical protein CRV08_02485 [Halarcobacter ebronensis]|uniref:Uncharacterized protein n=1 Tax=Halarcobacter ebronensis TaxID=1462615 RepID=A0A4Q0YKL2_9BACT|nr:hypothetical protein [Halarcobacter ebronensis]QKF82899.1 hypothetical protein AEBR_2432 [Halarcobacter ebronensis]RXJ69591.1 hypothetical protein CRV08_02485 [Halarcobacter ebronensis]RXK06916.1 hypothetical protein CRV07_05670 [Halarcobacter ebronensis]
MVDKIVTEMIELVKEMQSYIEQDIEDIKNAKHAELLNRNDIKQELIDSITLYKQKLNEAIVAEMKEGIDVNIYRDKVDNLEVELRTLYDLNRKLALIVEPIQKMYKDIVDEIAENNGGVIFDVKA